MQDLIYLVQELMDTDLFSALADTELANELSWYNRQEDSPSCGLVKPTEGSFVLGAHDRLGAVQNWRPNSCKQQLDVI